MLNFHKYITQKHMQDIYWYEIEGDDDMRSGSKICIVGAGSVGATIACSITVAGMVSEIVLIDTNNDKAEGEALDILEGTPFCSTVKLYAGDYEAAKGADIVVITSGQARKPGQSRIDLTQNNFEMLKTIAPEIVKYAPDAIYVMVSNPVDILTYVMIKYGGLPPHQIIGSGTLLDSARLRTALSQRLYVDIHNIHAYVFGEHGETSMIPWSLATVAGVAIPEHWSRISKKGDIFDEEEMEKMAKSVRGSGGRIIKAKGATYYGIALSVKQICETILRNTRSALTVSTMINGAYGINDVCLSVPCIVGINGIERSLEPALLPKEEELLRQSADALKTVLKELDI